MTMKIEKVKLLISFVICALIGYLCFIVAPATENRNWISLIIATLSLFLCFAPALAFKFESAGNRSVSGKLVGWIFFCILVIENFLFCANECKISVYIVVTALITVVGVGIIYSISKS